MANEIQIAHRATGKTLYAVIRNSTGAVWQTTTSTFVTYSTANIANYDIALTEQGTASRFYAGTFPSSITAGIYFVAVYERAGASPAETDLLVGAGEMYWDGSAVADMEDFKASTGTPPTAAAIADAVWDEARSGHTTAGSFGEGINTIAISGDSDAADTLEAMLDGTGGVALALSNFDDFKANVSGLSTFDPSTDTVDVGAVAGSPVTGVDDFKANVSGLSTFDPSTDTVDVGAVAGSPITGVDDFKANVSGLSTFDPSTDTVDVGAVAGSPVTGVDDFKANVSGLSTFDPSTDTVDVGAVAGSPVTGVDDFKANVSGLSTFDATTDAVIVGTINTDVVSADALAAGAANEIADAVLDRTNGIETSFTLRQAMRLVLSALAGKLSGAGGVTIAIRDVNDSKDRITATVDPNGNRTAVTTDVS